MAKGRNGKSYPDIVDACLRNAKTAGVKVFIGIDMSNNWWNVYGNDTTWLYNQMEFDNQICDELWENYKSKYPEAFYGWYWSYEVDNVNWAKRSQQKVLMKAMNMQLDHLIAKNEKLPFMWCPFMNSRLGKPPAYEEMWKFVFASLHTTEGDIFCPQDCVGAGGLKLDQVDTWFSALKRAVDTKPGLIMWSDVETFISDSWESATLDRVVKQLKIEQKYVNNYVTWEYCYYDSPNNTAPGYQETYLNYLKTGKLETTPPSAPSNFTTKLQQNGNILLNWDASIDNIGVCGYYVYRNGERIYKNQVPKKYRIRKNDVDLTSLTDVCLSPNTSYNYEVRAYDFAGNMSKPSKLLTVHIGEIKYLPNIVSEGCPYTVSSPDYTASKSNAKKLTDGKYADKPSIKDPAWEGFLKQNRKARDVVIDLGKKMPVQQFTADFLRAPSAMAYLPAKVEILVSSDNQHFKKVGQFPNPNVPDNDSAASYRYRYTLANPVEARYVDFRTTPQDKGVQRNYF